MPASLLTKISDLLTPTIEAQGVSLYDLELIKEGSARILRLYIDKDPSVDLNDCERVSRAAEAVLDAHDPIETAYYLEVSSPGVERKLSKPEHFTRYTGHKIALRLYAQKDGRKKYTGILENYNDGAISLIDQENNTHHFSHAQISACNLVVFDD